MPGELTPGLSFDDIPNGLKAVGIVPVAGWLQIFAYCAYVEFQGMKSNGVMGTSGIPGDFGFKVLTSADPAEKQKKLNAELANGRLAMMAIIGMFFQDGLTGSAWGDWSLYTASPLRAGPKCIEGLGGPNPNDFWDPAGLAEGKSDEQLIHWRNVEIKHGRVAMLACTGWFHVAAGWHPIGDYAAGVRLSNDPLVNVTQLSMGG